MIEFDASFFAGVAIGLAVAWAIFGVRQIRNRQRLTSAEERIEQIWEHLNIQEDLRRNPRRTGTSDHA